MNRGEAPIPLPAQVRRVAEEFVLADPYDAAAMASLAGAFRRITDGAEGAGPGAGELARSAAELVERDILGSLERIRTAHTVASRLVASLQAALDPGAPGAAVAGRPAA